MAHKKGQFKHSDETKKKMSTTRKALGIRPPSNKGKKFSDGHKKKIAESQRGSKGHNWLGGITPLVKVTRGCFVYRQWRSDVFMRDDYTCTLCGLRGSKLNVDHVKPLSVIFHEYALSSFQEVLDCAELWNINNGRTLCESCHRKTDTYGFNSIRKYYGN